MLKKLIINICLFILFIFSLYSESIFNSIKWKMDYKENNITLYTNQDKDHKLNFYKAEIVLDISLEDNLYNNLIDFDKYHKIFPKIFIFKKVEQDSDNINSGIYYSLLNFSPLKNRGYYISVEYYVENSISNKKYVVEWQPVTDFKQSYMVDENCIIVKLIYGRWQIIEMDGKIKLSVEYYNDFEVVGPKEMIFNVEKMITISALKDLIKYTMSSNKLTIK
jgi:hypothetical protein